MGQYKAVLWDLDGTLLYTLEDLLASTNRTLRHFGAQETDLEGLRKAVGNGARRQIASFLPGGMENPRFEEAMDFYRQDYSRHCNDLAKPYMGIPAILRQLRAAGVKMAIVSNKPQPATVLLWKAHFRDTLAFGLGERPGLSRKPAPDMVDFALERLGVSKEAALLVGDSEVDIATAKNAGIPCLSVSWGYRPREALEAAGATQLIGEPQALLNAILG